MVRIATIINTHALKGECKLYLHTDDPANRFLPGTIFTLATGEVSRRSDTCPSSVPSVLNTVLPAS